ncbi:LSU ribosomal protein L13P [Desulfitobacterium dichloroeliminans LMG P-21439]|uniref:Large ribosomal subunit protein uL13 n=1 Tax=Desulfitobacterium dichloroeliminans (strain LMG P-21439 / DCA1) TaxID=871963 RepID=L0F614_DESDL|nr:50S ribosomal protein L13 [Desulfitobacterium dichloroeliminans]AGA68076.1 LSU ribosomal protein L13P [Desulfitobacterium dichloroeliminans LMG P-21439]
MSTFFAKANAVERKWYVIDAADLSLGRLATEAARILRGKHKPTFTPNVDTGDHVIIINADKVVLTGKKLDQKMYRRHSGYPGGLKETPYRKLMQNMPERAVEHAVKGMLPHNKLGAQMYTKLKVYRNENHPHQAQQPEVWTIQQ